MTSYQEQTAHMAETGFLYCTPQSKLFGLPTATQTFHGIHNTTEAMNESPALTAFLPARTIGKKGPPYPPTIIRIATLQNSKYSPPSHTANTIGCPTSNRKSFQLNSVLN